MLALRGCVGAQPQRDVRRLHRLPHYPHQIAAQGVEVSLVPELRREGFQGLPRVVLLAIEPAIYEGLDAAAQGHEQRGDGEGGDDYGQLGLLLLACEGAEDRLGCRYASEVDQSQGRTQRAVNEGAVDDEVYVIEAVAQDGDTGGDRDRGNDKQERQGDDDPGQSAEGGLPEHTYTDERQGGGGGEPLDLLA